MTVIGPNWPSTRKLKEALADVRSTKVVNWGAHATDGLTQLQRYKAAGLRCPDFTDDVQEALDWVQRGHTVFGRRRWHTQGKDIVGYGHKAWYDREFWVKFIPSSEEFRQHVWNNRCIRIGRKNQVEEPWRVLLVRSRNNGWHIDYGYSAPDGLRERIRTLAKAGVSALGYVGGAADILHGSDGEIYLLEVNAAPSLRDRRTLEAYVDAITAWA